MNPWDQLIVEAYSGSLTYGTNITSQVAKAYNLKESDKDRVGICIAPKDYTLGLQKFEVKNFKEEIGEDYTIYALNKYVHLASLCNPNILELLFLQERFYIYTHPLFNMLLDNRYRFLSKKAKHTFAGYAYSQYQKMKTKRENGSGRQDLVDRFSYDVKFAMHCIRLVRQGIEVLSEGNLNVFRPDNKELLDIRLGKLTWEEFEELYNYERKRLDNAYENSNLPRSTDLDFLSKLCVDIHEEYYYSDLEHKPNLNIEEIRTYVRLLHDIVG